MGISIHIRFYNNFPPKNVINKTSFLRVEIIIRQFWKFAYLVHCRMAKDAQIIKRLLSWFSAMWVLFKHFIIEYSYCKMPRNSHFCENEKGQISAHKLEGKSISFIIRELLRSWTIVRNYLKDPESYGTRKRPGRPHIITNAAIQRLFREAPKGQTNSRDLQKSQNWPIAPRRVCQLLHESPNLVHRNRKTASALIAKQKMRVDWLKKKVTWKMEK